MLPAFKDKRVLDLGCGFGWHCQYAVEHGAKAVTGIDLSEKMLAIAKEKTDQKIRYLQMPSEDISFDENSFDIVISSLAFHYIESFERIAERVSRCLAEGGDFVFSVEHPVFTAYGSQNWYYDENGNILHFPIDNYFFEGERRKLSWRTSSKISQNTYTYLNGVIQGGFELTGVVEPQPSAHLLYTRRYYQSNSIEGGFYHGKAVCGRHETSSPADR